MLRNNTVLIVGAGASAEVGMPVGRELADQIKILLLNDITSDFHREMTEYSVTQSNIESANAAARIIINSMYSAPSIDALIDRFKDNPHVGAVGKAAIIWEIFRAEAKSFLKTDQTGYVIDEPSISNDTWYARLADILYDGLDRPNVDRVFNKLQIVCFNYDRCIEHYFFNDLVRAFNISYQQSAKIVNGLQIWHPYGTIGKLAYLNPEGLKFGQDIVGRCFELSSGIRTYSEQAKGNEELIKIRQAVFEAKRIVFLGFSYNSQNMALLTPKEFTPATNAARIYGTVFKEPSQSIPAIKDTFIHMCQPKSIELQAWECKQLLYEYKRTLQGN